jgi:superfamily II DNA/RNA helicase
LSTFDTFPLDPRLLEAVRVLGYITPTPIQTRAIPLVLEDRDVIGLAQTGTGKTAAFALPILQRLLGGPRGTLRALILAPTRELAEQIHQAITGLARQTGLRSATVYGGVPMHSQRRALQSADIAVACPGRLLDQMGE